MPLYYAGVGSQSTPESVCKVMKFIAQILCIGGYILNSGGAKGADSAFESGVPQDEKKQIILPYKFFNKNPSQLYPETISPELIEIAESYVHKFHPNPFALMKKGGFGFKAMKRNTFQVLGMDLKTPVDFVCCWTKDGKASGGTGQAIRIARHHGIKVYNLYNEDEYNDLYHTILKPILLKSFGEDKVDDNQFSLFS